MAFQATARLKYVSIPPRKMRLVAKLVKGLPIEKALDILNFTPKIAAHHMAKTLKSAAANALSLEGTDNLKPEDLVVKNIIVDSAPTQKRIRFQSMGRVFRYRKRFSHLTVIVEEQVAPEVAEPAATPKKVTEKKTAEEEKPAKAKRKTAAKKTAAKKTAAKKSVTKRKTASKAKAESKDSEGPAAKSGKPKAAPKRKAKAKAGAKAKGKTKPEGDDADNPSDESM